MPKALTASLIVTVAVAFALLPSGRGQPTRAVLSEMDSSALRIPHGPGVVDVHVFFDYACTYCVRLEGYLRAARRAYPDLVVGYHLVPQGYGPHRSAALAAVCAARKGSFEALHILLISSPTLWSQPTALAEHVGEPSGEFEHCLTEDRARAELRRMSRVSRELRVRGTPALYYNGKLWAGLPYDSASFVESLGNVMAAPHAAASRAISQPPLHASSRLPVPRSP